MQEKKRTIYLDADGVLVDFDKHFFDVHGVETKTLKNDNAAFWKLFDTKRDGFFRDCPPMNGHIEFVNNVFDIANRYDYKVEMLTALPRMSTHPTAQQEKQDWMFLHGLGLITMNVGPYAIDKQKWHKPGDILIDDTERNILQWREKGGTAIHHKSFGESIQILRAVVS